MVFPRYALYSWGTPLIVIIVTIVIQNLPDDVTENLIRPGIGDKRCFLDDRYVRSVRKLKNFFNYFLSQLVDDRIFSWHNRAVASSKHFLLLLLNVESLLWNLGAKSWRSSFESTTQNNVQNCLENVFRHGNSIHRRGGRRNNLF